MNSLLKSDEINVSFAREFRLYLATEFAHHGSLANYMENLPSKRLQENEVQKWFAQLLEALAHCHSQGWAHCNVTSTLTFASIL